MLIFALSPTLLLPTALGDDGLFVKRASSIVQGDWLGPFNVFTLAKGPGYDVFLALNYWIGLPITVSEAILFCFSLAIFSYAVATIFKSNVLGATIFCVTILHPSFLVDRILRDAIYSSQTFLFLGTLLIAFFVPTSRRLVWAGFCGVAMSWLWLTREEGVWILPGMAILVLGGIGTEFLRKREWQASLAAFIVLVCSAVVVQISFCTINFVAYGKFQGVDVKEKNFVDALKAVQSVTDGQQIPYVAVSKSTRRIIYEVSPTFAQLKRGLDPSAATEGAACKYYKWTCGDIGAGWFMFAMKGAAAGAGAYRSPSNASAFFGRIATEVHQACADGRLHCEANPVPFMPRISQAQIFAFPAKFFEALIYLMQPSNLQLFGRGTGTEEQRSATLEFLHYPAVVDIQKKNLFIQPMVSHVRKVLEMLYKFLLPLLISVGLVAMTATLLLAWRKHVYTPLIIAASLWVFVAVRLGLIAMIEISSFPAINKWYLSPALYLSIPASIVSVYAFFLSSHWHYSSRSAQVD